MTAMSSHDTLIYRSSLEDRDYKEEATPRPRKRSRRKLWTIIAIILLVVAVAVGLGVFFALRKVAHSSASSTSGNVPTGPVDQTVNITLLSTAPQTAISLLPTLFSISIEQDRWPEWVGANTPNQYFLNVLNNVQQITGTPVSIRIGADSEVGNDSHIYVHHDNLLVI